MWVRKDFLFNAFRCVVWYFCCSGDVSLLTEGTAALLTWMWGISVSLPPLPWAGMRQAIPRSAAQTVPPTSAALESNSTAGAGKGSSPCTAIEAMFSSLACSVPLWPPCLLSVAAGCTISSQNTLIGLCRGQWRNRWGESRSFLLTRSSSNLFTTARRNFYSGTENGHWGNPGTKKRGCCVKRNLVRHVII